jgi:Zn-dependent protease/CBS domain-containing protein
VFGGRSLKLATIAGVRVGVNPSWFVVLFLLIYLLAGSYDNLYPDDPTLAFALAAASALLLFASVVLHELGHAIVAIRNGIEIVGIDLFIFGGVAKMRRDTDSPGVEFRVAIAGPVVTLLVALACIGAGLLVAGPEGFVSAMRLDTGAGPVAAVLGYLAAVNVLVLLFNLLPGFPLDGGRIVRSIAWKVTGDRGKATRFAATIGQGFSYLLILLGVILLMLPYLGVPIQADLITAIWLIFIGLMLGGAARQARLQSRATDRIAGVRVSDVMDSEPVAIPVDATLERASEEFFLRYRWPWFPVVDGDGRLVGLLTDSELEDVDEDSRRATPVSAVMTPDSSGTLRVRTDESLESLLDSRTDGLRRLGAVLAVDREGVLRGVVTVQRVQRALRSAQGSPA